MRRRIELAAAAFAAEDEASMMRSDESCRVCACSASVYVVEWMCGLASWLCVLIGGADKEGQAIDFSERLASSRCLAILPY